ncbi:MAG: CGGC domain-containing protein [Candidatus Zixiibacteriota bacterium]|nr:MAG: CGGC domain-containing protein [candidate division Zixibacteria bacterium]
MKRKLGILTCSNMTQVLDCPVGGCLNDLRNRQGAFALYENSSVDLVGTISCNGCPTSTGYDVILPRVAGLVHYGMTHLHLSYCMVVLCPFANKYAKAIKAGYPGLEVVMGTHEPHQSDDEFRKQIRNQLAERHTAIIP